MVAAYHQRKSQVVTCACGCGEVFDNWRANGRRPRFVNGHNGRKYASSEVAQAARLEKIKAWRHNNPESSRAFKTKHYRTKKLKAMEILGNACYFCGLPYDGTNAPVFEFHHIDPSQKDSGISKMLVNASMEAVVREIQKCVLACANCHNRHHGGIW